MGLKGTIEQSLRDLVGYDWQIRIGTTVPQTEKVVLRNGAVKLDAVYLYADMMGSTQLVSDFKPETAAKVMRAFISTACRVIRYYDGHIRSFDGDRVMGIFVGDNKNTRAVNTALEIKHATDTYVRPALESRLPSLPQQGFVLSHVTGVASGPVFIARAGIHEHNDLISVGTAANVAAKLSDIREKPQHRTYITPVVFRTMGSKRKIWNGQELWEAHTADVGGEATPVYRSSWGWTIS
ncbi:adenylate/guanylate cyclase domain-containing protein [Streptomyces pseudoechinosporeus]